MPARCEESWIAVLLVAACATWRCGGTNLSGDGADDAEAPDADVEATEGGRDNAPDGGDPGADGEEPDTDGGPDSEVLGDGFVLDAEGWEGSEYVVLPPPSGCGDGIVDPGEECDDWNRLDGDGCDWLCRLGDGDPPPTPDPGVPDYVPSGDPAPLPGSAAVSYSVERIPLVWTGSEFATAWFEPFDVDADPGLIRFWRFDASGRRLDDEWRMPTLRSYGGLEVVWTGSGFALFFGEWETGLWYLRLDAHGKPLGDPVLIEGDPRAMAPAADLAPDGTLVVAWVREEDSSVGWTWCVPGSLDLIRVRRIDVDGNLLGPVFTLDDTAQGPPDIATGDGGFGLVFPVAAESWDNPCALRFERLDAALDHPVSSGVLGGGGSGDVKWVAAESRWVTSWGITLYAPDPPGSEVRVASFSADGILAGPPIRNLLAGGPEYVGIPVRIAAGDGGLSLVFGWGVTPLRVSYLRTDRHGVAVAPLHDVISTMMHLGSYNTVWTDEGFAVLYTIGWPFELRLQHYVRAE